METIQELLGSVRDYFFQLKNNIEWFHSFIGTNAEISNDEMPKMQEQDGDQKRQTARKSTATRTRKELGVHVLARGTRSTSTDQKPRRFQTARKSTATRTRKELGVHVLTRGTRSTSTLPPEENTLNEEPEEEKI